MVKARGLLGPIFAGAFAASTLTAVLVLVGSGLGLTMVSPWGGESASLTSVAVSTAIWLIVVQWLSSAAGGYLAGRLRTKSVGVHTDESISATPRTAFCPGRSPLCSSSACSSSALTSIVGGGVQAASTMVSGIATGAGAAAGGAANAAAGSGTGAGTLEALSYFTDQLFRPNDPARLAAPGPEGDATAAAQATRILTTSAAAGQISPEDKTYLAQLIAARTGVAQPDAEKRIDQAMAAINDAKTKAKEAADAARKAGATFALVSALSLVIGAFIASVAAAYGGRQRDEQEDLMVVARR